MKAKEIRNAYGCYEVWTGPKNGVRVASFTSKAKANVFFDALTDDVISKLESHAALVSALEGIVAMQDSIDPEGLFEGVEMAKCRAALAFVKAQQ